ncbi:MAG TPA: hypothetical protein VIS74_07505 [Chthoniobacterales bacterium]
MQTTLRLDDQLYREAKAEAAREGTTLTRFLEDAIRLRLRKKSSPAPGEPHPFPLYEGGAAILPSDETIKEIAVEEEERYLLKKFIGGSTR